MPVWSEIREEIRKENEVNPYELVRKRYIKKLHTLTGRNIISYYSAFLSKDGPELSIGDLDKPGFMTTIKGMDRSKGLDLILHTPGGNILATESIVDYLRALFDTDIRVIVPQLAMSAGTMIACAGKEIIMGSHSSLGPIDPQIGPMPALNIIKVFNEAKEDLKNNPANEIYWAMQFIKYPASLLQDCYDAVALSDLIVTNWLLTGMFKGEKNASPIVDEIVKQLNQNEASKSHGRHFSLKQCEDIGLKIFDMAKNDALQDIVLSLHSAYIIMLLETQVAKIIESQLGEQYILTQPTE